MKSLITTSLVAMLVLSTNNAYAGKHRSDSQLFTECKASLEQQIGVLQNSRLVKLKRYGKNFTAKIRVKAEQHSGLYLCTINPSDGLVVARIDGKTPNVAKAS